MENTFTGLRSKLTDFFSKGHSRTLVAKKNVAFSFLLKGGSILVSLLVVPLTINYVNKTTYGIWLTLSSLITWFSFFDIGLSNGLKNKLSQAIAVGDHKKAKAYISTAYVIMTIISCTLITGFLAANQFINWAQLLNAPVAMQPELKRVAMIVFSVFAVQFVIQLINILSFAKQNTRLTALIGFLGNLIGFVTIWILTKVTAGSLTVLCLSIGVSPLIVLLIFTVVMFNGPYRMYLPQFRLASRSLGKDILQLGIKFFFIQLGVIFFYNADNIIISHYIGPAAVTPYNIAYKYFGVITMLSGIIMTPFWPAFTEAHFQKDNAWIKRSVLKLQKICAGILLLGCIMFLVSDKMYQLWVGDKIVIPRSLSLVLMAYVCLNTFRTIFSYYSSAVNKISIQLIIVLASGLINIPLGIFLGKKYGPTGVILSTTALCMFCAVIELIQYSKLVNNRAEGIWNR